MYKILIYNKLINNALFPTCAKNARVTAQVTAQVAKKGAKYVIYNKLKNRTLHHTLSKNAKVTAKVTAKVSKDKLPTRLVKNSFYGVFWYKNYTQNVIP